MGLFDAAAGATPYGAAANAALAVANTPNTSRSGDISGGQVSGFSNTIGGLNFGPSLPHLPTWAWLVIAAAGVYVALKLHRK